MKISKPYIEIESSINGKEILKHIEKAGRVCYFLKLRTSQAAHPQVREIALMILEKLKYEIPVVFDDMGY